MTGFYESCIPPWPKTTALLAIHSAGWSPRAATARHFVSPAAGPEPGIEEVAAQFRAWLHRDDHRQRLLPAAVTCYACGQHPAMGGGARKPICHGCRAIQLEFAIEDIEDEMRSWLGLYDHGRPPQPWFDRAARRYLAYRHAYKHLLCAAAHNDQEAPDAQD